MFQLSKCLKILTLLILFLPLKKCQDNTTNKFIVEYFFNKSPSTVIGFTCNRHENDVDLMKEFSGMKLQSVIWKLEDKIEVSLLAKAIHYKLGIFIDLRCQIFENVVAVLNEATNYRMYGELHHWLILGSNLNESLSLVNDDSFGVSTNFVVAILDKNQYVLYDIYNPCKVRGGTLKTAWMGNWNEKNGLNILSSISKLSRWNLKGMSLKMNGVVKNKPKNTTVSEYLRDYNFKEFDRMTRLAFMMWIHVAEMYNFTFEFYENTPSNNGDESTPVMNALAKTDIDLGGTAEEMSNERITSATAVYPAFPFRSCFIFRSTSSDRLSVRDIFLPLSSTVWYLTIGLSVLSINALALLLFFTNEDFYENYLSSIIIHVGAFCQQGTEFSSQSLSGRIAILHILLFNLLLYNYYLASAVSNRLSEPVQFINDSLHELRKKDFQYASEPMLDFDRFIKNNDWETRSFYSNTWKKIPESQRFMSPEKGLAQVLEGGFAYHTYPDISYPYINRYFDDRKICEIQEVHLIRPTHLSIFIHVNSSFTEMFKNGFLRLSEVGIRNRQLQQWTERKPACRTDILTADSITIKEVAPAIIFLLFSILVSSGLLTAENLVMLYCKRFEKSKLSENIKSLRLALRASKVKKLVENLSKEVLEEK